MKSYLEYITEDPDSERQDAIKARTSQLRAKAEAEVDRTGNPAARKRMAGLARRELEDKTGISFDVLNAAFKSVHGKKP